MFKLLLISMAVAMTLLNTEFAMSYPHKSSIRRSGEIEPRQLNSNLASADSSLIQALELAPTLQQRQSILTNNGTSTENLVFSFINNTVVSPTGGTITLPDAGSFPAMIGTNVDLAIGFVNPCGINTPHSHPRANEFLTVVQGELVVGQVMQQDTGSSGYTAGGSTQGLTGPTQMMNYTLGLYQGTVFYQGLTHYQYNPTCEPALFAASFDNVDPGRVEAAATLFSILDNNIIMSAVGYPETLTPENINGYRTNVPTQYASLIDTCAQQCGLASS